VTIYSRFNINCEADSSSTPLSEWEVVRKRLRAASARGKQAMASIMSKRRARISTGTLTRSNTYLDWVNTHNYFCSNAKKLKTLSMYKEGKAQRNASGKVTKAASYQSRELPKARVEPNRKWFGNTRVISQNALDSFRSAVAERASDPYQVLLKTNKLPMSLIRDAENTKNGIKQHQAKIAVESAPFGDTFGPKSQRKRVKLDVGSLEDMAGSTVKMHDSYLDHLEEKRLLSGQSEEQAEQTEQDGELTTAREPIFSKGQSKRIWNELYKVIDSSDVVIHVLDARDPEGTRCRSVEKYIREEAPHKHLVFVLNKCDLVPTSVAVSQVLSLITMLPHRPLFSVLHFHR
jgi:nuclear GTP-binding protein